MPLPTLVTTVAVPKGMVLLLDRLQEAGDQQLQAGVGERIGAAIGDVLLGAGQQRVGGGAVGVVGVGVEEQIRHAVACQVVLDPRHALREDQPVGIDASGLAPLRHTERRLKRSERAVSFVRDQGAPRILFSAREGDEPLRPGAQDRLSWIAQLATRMASPPGGDWRPGSSLAMDVASTGGDVQRWVFTIEGREASGLWHLRREPDSLRDTRAEVWIDARQQHWPVRIQLTEPSGEPLELTLDGLQPA